MQNEKWWKCKCLIMPVYSFLNKEEWVNYIECREIPGVKHVLLLCKVSSIFCHLLSLSGSYCQYLISLLIFPYNPCWCAFNNPYHNPFTQNNLTLAWYSERNLFSISLTFSPPWTEKFWFVYLLWSWIAWFVSGSQFRGNKLEKSSSSLPHFTSHVVLKHPHGYYFGINLHLILCCCFVFAQNRELPASACER